MTVETSQRRQRTLRDYYEERRGLYRKLAVIRALAEASRELEIWEVRAVLDRIAQVAGVDDAD